jgi:RimJ/RimL family protein N-acetyltransferase
MQPVLSVPCKEKKGTIIRKAYPLIFTAENLATFWEKSRQFPVLFGKKLESIEDFSRYFFTEKNGSPWLTGLFWVVDDFVGVFYLTEIFHEQADAHFTFFDKRLEGREELTREMMRHVFREFPSLIRLNVSLPCYVNEKVFQFVSKVGFKMEGKKRSCAQWKGKWFDAIQYGILKTEILTEPQTVEDLTDGRNN